MSSFGVSPYSRSVNVPNIFHSTPMQVDMSTNKTTINYNQYVYNNVTINQKEKENQKPAKRAIMASKTTSHASKTSGNNNKVNKAVVLRILDDINMTKYSHKFKNYNLEKFKELSKLDLIAMGITRRLEVNKFVEAISKANFGLWD